MRLAVFTNQFPNRVSTFFARDMRGLIEAGMDIDIFPIYPLDPTLWCYVPDLLNEKILPRSRVRHVSVAEALSCAKSWRSDGLSNLLLDIARIGASAATFGIKPLLKTAYAFLMARAVAQQCRSHYDHVLCYWGSYAATYAYIFHRLTHHDTPFSMFLHAGDLYQNQVYLRQKLLYSDNIFVVCDFNRRYIRNHYKDIYGRIYRKIHVYHPGLDFAEFEYSPDNVRPNQVIGVGNFDKCKGFDYLIRAIHQLACSGTDVQLELIGDGHQTPVLKKIVTELGLENRIRFRGWLRSDEVSSAMRAASILVHPSSTEGGDAVPTVIKEAMALGTPVIASDLAGIPELLDGGRCGILVAPRDVNAMSTAIKSLLTNEELRRSYVGAARSYAEQNFDVRRNAQQLADILRSTTRRADEGCRCAAPGD